MNSTGKAFAIFVGAIMVLSAFASFVMMGGDQSENAVVPSGQDSLQTFGVQGRYVEWDFEGLPDVLQMSPESTVMAYWINLSASENLTQAVTAALPQSMGLHYGDQIHNNNKIEKLADAFFNDSWTEFHAVKPYPVGYDGLVIPYQDYMMIPAGTDYSIVFGKPALFGPKDAVEQVLNVIMGELSAQNFTLIGDNHADLQVAALGTGGKSMPLSGGYKEFYLGVNEIKGQDGGFDLRAMYLQPQSETSGKIAEIASKNNLSLTATGPRTEISGVVAPGNLQTVLMALLGP